MFPKYILRVSILICFCCGLSNCAKDDTPQENRPPGAFEIESIEYENQNFSIKWTAPDDPDQDLITYSVFIANEKVLSATSSRDFSGTLSYNSTETGRIIATDSQGGNSEISFTLEMPKSKILFFSDIEDNFYALDIRTNKALWQSKMNPLGRGLHSTIGDQVFVHYEDLTSNNILTGEVNWRKESTFHLKFDTHFLVSDGEALYRKLHYKRAERLDKINGGTQWSIPLFESKGPMGLDSENVYLIDRNAPDLRVYDKKTGEEKWTFDIPYIPTENGSQLGHTPVTDNGTVYLRTTYARVYALSKTNGEIVWDKRLANEYLSNYRGNESVPVFFGDNLIVVAHNKIYALNKNNGNTIWETNLGAHVYSSPFIYKEQLYLSSDEYLYCVNANSGVLKWKRNLPTFQQISPIVYEDVVYTGGNDYYYAFNTSDGSEIWRYPIDTYSFTSPTLLIGESEEIIYPSINPSTN